MKRNLAIEARGARWGTILLLIAVASTLSAQDSPAPTAAESSLINAYQREFIFLDNEIRILEGRLREVRADGEARLQDALVQLQEREGQLLETTAQVDRRNEELRIVLEEEGDVQTADDQLRNIVTQANARLRDAGRETFVESGTLPADAVVTDGERLSAELQYVFDASFDLLRERGTIRTETGAFFLQSGQEVTGDITYVGMVGALGAANEDGGTLAPAGGGRLRLVQNESRDVAEDILRGVGTIDTLPLFLYDSLDELVETDRGTTLRETIEGGGVIGLVIIFLGFVGLVLVGIRVALLLRVARTDTNVIDSVFAAVREERMDDALSAAKGHGGAMGRVLAATVDGIRVDPAKIEDVISEAVLNESPVIDRFRSAIAVFAAVAPLLGLLGTVTGMIATFEIITQYGTGDPKLLSGGISEALITTEFGLIVAIPLLLVGNLLSSWAERVTSNIEIAALRVVNIVSGYGDGKGAA